MSKGFSLTLQRKIPIVEFIALYFILGECRSIGVQEFRQYPASHYRQSISLNSCTPILLHS